jgi:hypothetical protein
MPIQSLSNKRLMPRLGKIRLGYRHPEKGYPVRTDYFIFPKTHPAYSELVRLFGSPDDADPARRPRELRILIPAEDEEKWFSQYYRCYSASRGLICKGDGQTASRVCILGTHDLAWKDPDSEHPLPTKHEAIECHGRDCEHYQLRHCQEVANLQFIIPEVAGLGIWQIDTGSINSIININSASEMIKGLFGRISMIPLLLTLEEKEVPDPETGKKRQIFVLNLRSNAKMMELPAMARQQKQILSLTQGYSGLPMPDDEAPEFMESYDPLAPDTHTPAENIEQLWGEGKGNTKAAAGPTSETARAHVAGVLTQESAPAPAPAPAATVPLNSSRKTAKRTEPSSAGTSPVPESGARKFREPGEITDWGLLYGACMSQWPQTFKIRDDVLKEGAGVSSQRDTAMSPAEIYIQILAVRAANNKDNPKK